MPIVMLLNMKGGVAKTTTAVALAECLASQGYETLLIDADHQNMAGELLLGEARLLQTEKRRRTLYDLLAVMLDDTFSSAHLDEYVAPEASNIAGGLPLLSVLPCSMRIDDFSTNMAKARKGHLSNQEFLKQFNKRKRQLKRWLVNEFDYTIIDCPPALSIQVKFLLSVADSFIIPTIPDRLSVRGSLYLMDRLSRSKYTITGLGTLWSLYREQNAVHRYMVAATERGFEPFNQLPDPFETIIPNATKIAQAADIDEIEPSSFRSKYTHRFAELYEDLVAEMLERLETVEAPATAG